MKSLLTTLSLLAALFTGIASAAEKPNIVLVITDDQGYGPVAAHGHPWIKTPNLDKLHAQSTRFTRFLVSPTCSPTRAALMSGRHPMKNGITHTILERERMALSTVTLPEALKTAGYTTGIFGKWHLGDEEPYQPHNRGFDEAFIHGAGGIGQAYNCSCADAPGNKYTNPTVRHNGSFVTTEGFCTDVFFHAALGWIKKSAAEKKPFFAYITTNAPHGPFIAPEKNAKRFTDLGFDSTAAGFYGMIENIDENIGLLSNKLTEYGLDDNTVLIFMSDNGMTGNGARGNRKGKGLPEAYPLYNANMKGFKGSTDEGGVRVPFFVRYPGHFKAGRDLPNVTAHIDILPTLAELAGAQLPEDQVEGRSFLQLMKDPTIPWADRYLFTHKARWKTGADPDSAKWSNFAVRNHRFRLVGRNSLYDMISDPNQTTNVIDQHPDVAKSMIAAYEKFWAETKPLMVNESAPMSPTRPFHVLHEKQQSTTGIPAWTPPTL